MTKQSKFNYTKLYKLCDRSALSATILFSIMFAILLYIDKDKNDLQNISSVTKPIAIKINQIVVKNDIEEKRVLTANNSEMDMPNIIKPEPKPIPKPKPKPIPKPIPKPVVTPEPIKEVVEQPVEVPEQFSSGDSEPVETATEQTGNADMLDMIMAQLLSEVEKRKKYPRQARRAELQGIVNIEVSLTSGGNILTASIVSSDAHRILKNAAEKISDNLVGINISSAQNIKDDLKFVIPVKYEIID